jgi:YHS domain-containing protein
MVPSLFSAAQNTETNARKKHYNLSNGNLSVGGYDVVSYFTGKPKKGSKTFEVNHKGITYYFSSQSNVDLFKKSPEKFEPAYGGWCAYAMGNSGEKVEIDPETYKTVDGKLYLFYNAYFTNTLPKWNKDEKNLKLKADKNWLTLFK